MKDFLEYILKLIVDKPESLHIEESQLGERSFHYNIHADKDDVGKIIGKQGKIIQALRNIAKVLAVKDDLQVRIEIV